jgi:hypothetical protein
MKLSVKPANRERAVALAQPPPPLKIACVESTPEPSNDLLIALVLARKLPSIDLEEILLAGHKPMKLDDALPAGEFTLRGEITLAVDVAILKEDPVEARQGCRIDVAMIVTALCERLEVKPSAVAAVLEEAMLAADKGEVEQLYLDVVQPVIARVAAEISEALPREIRRGAIRVTGDVELTGFEPL